MACLQVEAISVLADVQYNKRGCIRRHACYLDPSGNTIEMLPDGWMTGYACCMQTSEIGHRTHVVLEELGIIVCLLGSQLRV